MPKSRHRPRYDELSDAKLEALASKCAILLSGYSIDIKHKLMFSDTDLAIDFGGRSRRFLVPFSFFFGSLSVPRPFRNLRVNSCANYFSVIQVDEHQ